MRSVLVMLIVVAAAAIVIAAQAGPKPSKAEVARGEYIVNRVSMCVDCHTPMTKQGKHDEKRKFAGAPITFKPTVKVPHWMTEAPNLTPAGILRQWSDAALVKFLMTGAPPDAHMAHPPMPPYRLNTQDAKAVTAYLRSLPPVR